MKITTTNFDSNYHGSQKAGNRGNEYMRHNVDVFNNIKIDGVEHHVLYQTAMSYLGNDLHQPDPDLALSDFGTSELLLKIDTMCETDIESLEEEDFAEFTEICPSIVSKETLLKIYNALNENLHNARRAFEELKENLDISDNVEDCVEDEATGCAVRVVTNG